MFGDDLFKRGRPVARHFLTGAFVLALAAGSVVACGDDDDDDQTPTTTTTQPASSPTSGSTSEPTSGATPTTPASSPTTGGGSPTTNPDGTVAPQNPGDTESKTVKSDPDPISGIAIVDDLRLGHHPEEGGWERIVFEMEGDIRPSAVIEYVDNVMQCGSGQTVKIEGDAILMVTLNDAQAHTDAGEPTLDDNVVGTPPGGKTILEGMGVCDFEGQVQWAFGLTGKQNFKVTTLENPTRIVIDIKQ